MCSKMSVRVVAPLSDTATATCSEVLDSLLSKRPDLTESQLFGLVFTSVEASPGAVDSVRLACSNAIARHAGTVVETSDRVGFTLDGNAIQARLAALEGVEKAAVQMQLEERAASRAAEAAISVVDQVLGEQKPVTDGVYVVACVDGEEDAVSDTSADAEEDVSAPATDASVEAGAVEGTGNVPSPQDDTDVEAVRVDVAEDAEVGAAVVGAMDKVQVAREDTETDLSSASATSVVQLRVDLEALTEAIVASHEKTSARINDLAAVILSSSRKCEVDSASVAHALYFNEFYSGPSNTAARKKIHAELNLRQVIDAARRRALGDAH